jgi:hypothetical protein
MFMLYAVVAGLLVGAMTAGDVRRLGSISIRWAPLALAGLLAQVVLFSGPIAEHIGWLGLPIYLGSTAMVLAVVLRNARLPGLALSGVGAISNMAAIVANGGYMPASAQALASLGKGINAGYSNSRIVEAPALAPFTDIFALPRWFPFSNVFSVGDVLIGLGIAILIIATMRGGAPRNLPRSYGQAGTTEP